MKISLIVPVYNGAKTIERLINSILNQSYCNYEVIIVNDGSTDNTLELLNKIIGDNDKFTIINIDNSGVSNARNIALKNVSDNADIIMFADCDDELLKNSFEIVSNNFNDNDIITFDYFENSKLVTNNNLKIDNKKDYYEKLSRKLLFNQLWNKAFKKSILKGLCFNKKLNLGEDLDFNIRVLNKCMKYKYMNFPIYKYYLYNNGLSFSKRKNIIDIKKKMYKNVDVFYSKNNFNKSFLYKQYQKAYIQGVTYNNISNRKELIMFNKNCGMSNDFFSGNGLFSFMAKLVHNNNYLLFMIFDVIMTVRDRRVKSFLSK